MTSEFSPCHQRWPLSSFAVYAIVFARSLVDEKLARPAFQRVGLDEDKLSVFHFYTANLLYSTRARVEDVLVRLLMTD